MKLLNDLCQKVDYVRLLYRELKKNYEVILLFDKIKYDFDRPREIW